MTFNLTDEQKRESFKQIWIWNAVGALVIYGFFLFFRLLSGTQGALSLEENLVILAVVSFAPFIFALYKSIKLAKKGAESVELRPNALVFYSSEGEQETPYSSVKEVVIGTDPAGQVLRVFVRAEGSKPLRVLKGYDDMNRLAQELEKSVADPNRVKRVEGKPSGKAKASVSLMMIGIVLGSLLVMVGVIFGMAKLGFGFLIGPLSFMMIGVINFQSNRNNRQKRLTGIAIIFMAIAWAGLKFFTLIQGMGH